jgi:phosphodiesterase/alkaline phosphatase D-like protein
MLRKTIFPILVIPILLIAPGLAHSAPPSLSGDLRIMAGPIAQNVSDSSANIFWLTSRESRMTLKYGSAPLKLDHVVDADDSAGAAGNRAYKAKLKGLQPNETYFFQIIDERGKPFASGEFQTEPREDTQPNRLKIIDGPVFEYLDSASVEIAWTTNAQSSTLVRYGTNPNNLRKTAQAPWGQETHRVTIPGLEPNTTYYFVVESGQASDSGTMAKSSEGSFRTEYAGEAALTNIAPRR